MAALLKDVLFNAQTVSMLSAEIVAVYPAFARKAFYADVMVHFPELELKERITHIAVCLYRHLPCTYDTAVDIIVQALPQELDPACHDDDFGSFIYAAYGEYIARYGCTKEHVERSLEALCEITKRFYMEFAIREFVNAFTAETLEMLYMLSTAPNYHQRRLVSEGLRPKLPWGKALHIDYREPLRHLDNLFNDPTRFVTRSVANHLNDLSKMDAPLVLETLKRWQESQRAAPKEMAFITRHALRTLVKKGHGEALQMLGYTVNPNIAVAPLQIATKNVVIGDALEFEVTLHARERVKLMIDYVICFRTNKGTFTAKVHKLKTVALGKGAVIRLRKKHPFRVNMTTRKLYEGEHKVALQINGKRYDELSFALRHRE